MRTHKIVGILIVVSSLGLIAYQATRNESSVTFFTPAEVYANPKKFENRVFRVSGLVLEGSKNWDAQTQILTFQMSDLNEHNFFVSYKGIPPDLFKEKQGVIVEGQLSALSHASDSFQTAAEVAHSLNLGLPIAANLLMVKHSEVYNTQEDHSQMREVKLRESLFDEFNKN